MSSANTTRTPTTTNTPPPNPDWWRNPDLKTFADRLHAGKTNARIWSDQDLSDISRRQRLGRNRNGFHRSVFGRIAKGERGLGEEVAEFLSDTLGGSMDWWLESALSPRIQRRWKPPLEARSPHLTPKFQNALNDTIRAQHEASVQAWVAGHGQGQHDLIAAALAAGAVDDATAEKLRGLVTSPSAAVAGLISEDD